jgi:D-glycero-D-manno-heptose 1,7-bisphosphate phosphatase
LGGVASFKTRPSHICDRENESSFYFDGMQFFFRSWRIRPALCLVAGMKNGIFIERDGILNQAIINGQSQVSPLTLEQFQINEPAIPVLEELKAAGFVLIVATNQPALSHGTLSRRELDRMHDQLRKRFPIDDILVCPHDESDECPCRKPEPGLFTEAAFKWHLDLERSFVISDKWQDARAARAVGCTSLLLKSPWIGTGHHDFVLGSLSDIVAKIMRLQARHLAA